MYALRFFALASVINAQCNRMSTPPNVCSLEFSGFSINPQMTRRVACSWLLHCTIVDRESGRVNRGNARSRYFCATVCQEGLHARMKRVSHTCFRTSNETCWGIITASTDIYSDTTPLTTSACSLRLRPSSQGLSEDEQFQVQIVRAIYVLYFC